ncbi:MAG: aconitate hydratase [bacterium]
MKQNIARKIIANHLASGQIIAGEEIAISIDQTLTQDATGTMAYLQFETLELPQVTTKLSVSYVDHNMLQTGFENADDHIFLQSIAAKYGIYFSKPGNGICHQVHLERFGIPGQTLLGSDSHTPTAGGLGMLAIGVGGLDVAVAMGGSPFYMMMPKIVQVNLTGKLQPWVTAKDIILEMLRRLTVKGGVGKIFEYTGDGVTVLTVPERSTITNMGAELGATSSIFPSDAITMAFLKSQKREQSWNSIAADSDAQYDETINIDLSELEPLIAQAHSPDKVVKVKEIAGIKVHQVCIGSCTNSSYIDLIRVAKMVMGKKIHPEVSFTINPGSKQVLEMISRDGYLSELISAGVRILENACGPCIGMGQAPASNSVSIRSFNRNFEGRSGTASAQVYLSSPETAVMAALTGKITDPRAMNETISVIIPKDFLIDDSLIIPPAKEPQQIEIIRGPNIRPLPQNTILPNTLSDEVLLKVGDNITTDHIMPAGAKVLPLRSNIPAIALHVFEPIDPNFAQRALAAHGGFIIGGENYGQGSSREHAALAPMYLGIKAVFVKSFARIHRTNLINFGIIPLVFVNKADYDTIKQSDKLEVSNIRTTLIPKQPLTIYNITQHSYFQVNHALTQRQIDIILAGGLLNYIKSLPSKSL